ncbi:uncharacterized protein APUU_30254A [Aspergillus puulaauensis]|uniref:Uncharacterized protein n=1 Tax=Aspergillus puulaauensis TaxID=1220207 RepID=A0A7R8AJQ7_9EURO|nr:uncharacterized protein APUU_30254A [Aspergillus puulaauensis]BCS22029.1 hypothetical protein APUU_30254A [Aspergillus puulaauensis]
MTSRTVSLVSYRSTQSQRAHFGVFVPSADEAVGTLIQVVGAPMVGYVLEFKRNYCPDLTQRANSLFALGQVDSANIVDSGAPSKEFVDTIPNGNIEIPASEVQPPPISENFMAPVNDTTNKRCQEWTMEFVRHLVAKGHIGEEAVHIVQSKRDPWNRLAACWTSLRSIWI